MLFSSPFNRPARRAARARKYLGGCREEDVSAPPQEPQAHAWFSKAHEDAVWPRDHPSSSPQGAPAADRDGREEVGPLIAAGVPERRRERLPRDARVRLRKEYLAIQNRGRRVAGPNLLLFALGGVGRIGITVSRKVGGAVLRNRVKRWIRECYRRRRPEFPPGLDLVVVARPAAAAASHAVVARSWPRSPAVWVHLEESIRKRTLGGSFSSPADEPRWAKSVEAHASIHQSLAGAAVDLPPDGLPAAGAALPVRTDLLGLRRRGVAGSWPPARPPADRLAASPLPTARSGWYRRGSRA
jgi:ribonuclease P protein component